VAFEMAGKTIANSAFDDSVYSPSPLCKAQDFFIELGNISSIFWALAFCWDLFTVIQVNRPPQIPDKIIALPDRLLRRELLFLPACYGLAIIIAIIASVSFSGNAQIWCWTSSSDKSTSESLSLGFFYAWAWTTFLISIVVMVYALYDWITRPRDWKISETDIRPGCVMAFSAFLAIDLTIWLFASINRFSEFSNSGTFNPTLIKLQAWPGSARGLALATAYYLLWYTKAFKEPLEGSVYDIDFS